MEPYEEQLEYLCNANSIEYTKQFGKMRITCQYFDFLFDIDDKLIYKVKTCVDIISGKDDMINLVCNKLNTKKTCYIKSNDDYETDFDINTLCIKHKNNSIIVEIHNIDKVDLSNPKGNTYTSFNKYIIFNILIVFTVPLVEYYLVQNEDYFKLNTVKTLEDILKHNFELEQKQCARNEGY